MRIPESVLRAYEEQLAVIEPLQAFAGNRLRVVAADHHWLFDDRIKSPQSCLSKLEAGHRSLRDMHDFYAAMIVVPTQSHVEDACQAVLTSVHGEVRPARSIDATRFVYDDLHIVAKLQGKVSPRATHSAVLAREFEIQIHTGVQYAWWRATHDGIYKGGYSTGGSWPTRRASGQARAALELVDGVLADFETAAKLQRPVLFEPDPAESLYLWVCSLPNDRKPPDEIRFLATVRDVAQDAGVPLDDIASQLSEGDLDLYLSDLTITLVQVVLVCLHRVLGDELFARVHKAGRTLLITDELVAAYPPLGDAPPELRVVLREVDS